MRDVYEKSNHTAVFCEVEVRLRFDFRGKISEPEWARYCADPTDEEFISDRDASYCALRARPLDMFAMVL